MIDSPSNPGNANINLTLDATFKAFFEKFEKFIGELEKKQVDVKVNFDDKSAEKVVAAWTVPLEKFEKILDKLSGNIGSKIKKGISPAKKELEDITKVAEKASQNIIEKFKNIDQVRIDLNNLLKIEGADKKFKEFAKNRNKEYGDLYKELEALAKKNNQIEFAESARRVGGGETSSVESDPTKAAALQKIMGEIGKDFVDNIRNGIEKAGKIGRATFHNTSTEFREAMIETMHLFEKIPELLRTAGGGEELMKQIAKAKAAGLKGEAAARAGYLATGKHYEEFGGTKESRAAGSEAVKLAQGNSPEISAQMAALSKMSAVYEANKRKKEEPQDFGTKFGKIYDEMGAGLKKGSEQATEVLLGAFTKLESPMSSIAQNMWKMGQSFERFSGDTFTAAERSRMLSSALLGIGTTLLGFFAGMYDSSTAVMHSQRALDQSSGEYLKTIGDTIKSGDDLEATMRYATDAQRKQALGNIDAREALNMTSEEYKNFINNSRASGVVSTETGKLITQASREQIINMGLAGQAAGLNAEETAKMAGMVTQLGGKTANVSKSFATLRGAADYAGMDVNDLGEMTRSAMDSIAGFGASVDDVAKATSQSVSALKSFGYTTDEAKKKLAESSQEGKNATLAQLSIMAQMMKELPKSQKLVSTYEQMTGKKLSASDMPLFLQRGLSGLLKPVEDKAGVSFEEAKLEVGTNYAIKNPQAAKMMGYNQVANQMPFFELTKTAIQRQSMLQELKGTELGGIMEQGVNNASQKPNGTISGNTDEAKKYIEALLGPYKDLTEKINKEFLGAAQRIKDDLERAAVNSRTPGSVKTLETEMTILSTVFRGLTAVAGYFSTALIIAGTILTGWGAIGKIKDLFTGGAMSAAALETATAFTAAATETAAAFTAAAVETGTAFVAAATGGATAGSAARIVTGGAEAAVEGSVIAGAEGGAAGGLISKIFGVIISPFKWALTGITALLTGPFGIALAATAVVLGGIALLKFGYLDKWLKKFHLMDKNSEDVAKEKLEESPAIQKLFSGQKLIKNDDRADAIHKMRGVLIESVRKDNEFGRDKLKEAYKNQGSSDKEAMEKVNKIAGNMPTDEQLSQILESKNSEEDFGKILEKIKQRDTSARDLADQIKTGHLSKDEQARAENYASNLDQDEAAAQSRDSAIKNMLAGKAASKLEIAPTPSPISALPEQKKLTPFLAGNENAALSNQLAVNVNPTITLNLQSGDPGVITKQVVDILLPALSSAIGQVIRRGENENNSTRNTTGS